MAGLDYLSILMVVDGIIFLLGLGSFITGLVILSSNGLKSELQTLAKNTSLLAQKGFAEEISGLVGNASALMNALQQMVKTSAGIGVFLILIGTIFIGASTLFFFDLHNLLPL